MQDDARADGGPACSADGGLRVIDPPELGPAQGYANGILVPAGRQLLLVAGQIGWGAGQRLVGPGVAEQFAQALANVLTVVRAAGGTASDIARLTIYVVDRDEYAAARREIGRAYRELMGRHYPAMALLQVAALLEPGARVEIEATAALRPADAPSPTAAPAPTPLLGDSP